MSKSKQHFLSIPGTQSQPITQISSPSSSGELSPTDTLTSVVSDSDTDTTQVESPQNPNHCDNTKARNVKIPDEVMQKFLNTIGTDYYSDLDEYSPGLQHTSDGYIYAPDLMGSDQARKLHSFIIRMNTKPGLVKRMIKGIITVTSTT